MSNTTSNTLSTSVPRSVSPSVPGQTGKPAHQPIKDSRPHILVVEDDPSLRQALEDILRLGGYQVSSASDAIEALESIAQHNAHPTDHSQGFALVLSDVRMPNMDGHQLLDNLRKNHPQLPVLLMTAFGEIKDAVSAIQAGAMDYVVKPFNTDALLKRIKECLAITARNTNAGLEGDESAYSQSASSSANAMIAADPATRQLLGFARRVAATDSTVLITGESGTGKEVMARFVHNHSARAKQSFIAINCAAIPENMLEATLFGYEKGAFTGAQQATPGKFELAQGGTLLLDEISEMAPALQAKLLRVIQEREVERIGGRKTIKLDVRILATSNRQMLEAVHKGEFREDLYFRLNVIHLELLPLRERPGDIIPLAEALLSKRTQDASDPAPQLSDAAKTRLLAHGWPGNVRELGNTLERALVLHQGTQIEEVDLMMDGQSTNPTVSAPFGEPESTPRIAEAPTHPSGTDLRSREQDAILKTLHSFSGRRADTAKHLGISPRTLRYKIARMREHGIAIPGDSYSTQSTSQPSSTLDHSDRSHTDLCYQ